MKGDKKNEERRSGLLGSLAVPEPEGAPVSDDLLRTAIQEARDAARRFEQLLESAPDAVVGVDIEGSIVLVNAQTEKLFGYTREEMIGQSVEMLLPESVRRVHVRQRESFTAAPHVRPMGAGMDLQAMRKDGSHFSVEISLSPLETDDGLLITSIIRDVTQRKKDEEALRLSEENFRSLFERSPHGIFRSTPEGRIVLANPALVTLLGYESEEQVLQLDMERDVYQDPEQRRKLVAEHKHKKSVEGIELDWKRRDGTPITVRINSRAGRAPNSSESFYESVVEDITERKLLEAQLRQSQKMEAVGRLAGGIAHDFNNLLMVIQGFGELLGKSLEVGHVARRPLREILGAAQRATNLTRKLLSFSQKEKGSTDLVNLNQIVFGMEQMLCRMIREDVTLKTVLADDLGFIEADPDHIEQAILNLAVNARDAMPSGGEIRIQTDNAVLMPGEAQAFPGMAEGSFVRLRISDTGTGMDAETQTRIFEPFFTTKDEEKGTGLGLANVYATVSQSGGHITVFSQPGVGTRFDIYFPQSEGVASFATKTHQSFTNLGGTETILLVEDEDALRNLTHEFLQGLGYNILSAANGKDAVELSSAHYGNIDLLIADMIMPGMGGAQLAEHLQARRNELQVLFISGYSPDEVPLAGRDGRPTLFLQKPFPLDTLAAHIRQALMIY